MYDKNQMYIEREVGREEETLPSTLNGIASHIASGDFTPSSGAVLLFRCEETDTITIVRWGDETSRLLDEAAWLKKANA